MPETMPFFETRGVVLTPEDLTLADWPERAREAGLTTLALHPFPGEVAAFVRSPEGRAFLERCGALGLEVEYELHAMAELLPRSLFAEKPELFRMDDAGERTPDANLCVHSAAALDIAAANAVASARVLRPTTGRYFLWGDDARPYCRCPRCRELSDSEQALLLENHLLRALRAEDPRATLAHLAYAHTLPAPRQVRPEPGILLEFAPIGRRYDVPFAAQTDPALADRLEVLDANLEVFPTETAQVLEYWLDVSRFARWKRPAADALPWRQDVFAADLEAYARRGIRHVTSFAVWVDADYVARFGEPPLPAYGAGLRATSDAVPTANARQ